MIHDEYEKVRKSLKRANKLLVEAINVIEENIYTETKLVDVVSAFGNMLVKVLGESIDTDEEDDDEEKGKKP